MKTILVPLDFSDATDLVVREAAALAASLPAKIVLLHIVEPIATQIPVGASMDLLSLAPTIATQNVELDEDFTRLESIAGPLRAAGAEVECITIQGLAVDDIVAQAVQRTATYILLGSHGHGALYHLFGGNVVTGVLRHAPCPVLVVPIGRDKGR